MGLLRPSLSARIDRKLALIQKRRPLPAAVVAKLKEQFAIEMTFNSNAIEGNRLSLKETFLVISEGVTVKGKSLKEHLEAKDHYEAMQFLYDLIEHEKRHTLSEHLIRSLQQLVVSETDPKSAGSYRAGSVMITGSSHAPPEAHEIPHLMRQLVAWINSRPASMHPVEVAALAHHRLVFIHPFVDGNGRTARLLMNLLLMQKGYPLAVILKNDRKKYYEALDSADKGKPGKLAVLVAQAVERSMTLYLRALGSGDERYLPLSEIAKKSPFSAKYLNLLVRSGKLEAHKEGRSWVTSREALERYLAGRERKRTPSKRRPR
jgi:Fic family protein